MCEFPVRADVLGFKSKYPEGEKSLFQQLNWCSVLIRIEVWRRDAGGWGPRGDLLRIVVL